MLEIVSEPIAEGTVLADAFRLDHVLGSGGMGVVWAARDLETGRDVAVKVLADDRATDPMQQKRLLREASAAMKIDHPNVVKVSAVLETEAGVPFLVMERLEGESLRALLTRAGRLDLDTTLRIFREVLAAITAAHAAGILHRDLKPENVFLLKSGVVKVLDFGIAKRLPKTQPGTDDSASLTETGSIIGTPHYMAPEQIFGDEDVDARADTWSLGIILYECLAGIRPTDGEGFGQILKRILAASFAPLGAVRPDVPPRLGDLVMKMLARDRAARPSLAEVEAKLGQLDLPPSLVPLEPPSATATTAAHPAPTRPRSWRAIAIVSVVAAIGAGGWAVVASRARPAAPTEEGPDQMNLLLEASNQQAKMNGAACLAALDTFDRSPRRTLPDSLSLEGGSAGTRSSCLMLIGKCEEGKALYQRWAPVHGVPMDASLYPVAAQQMADLFCRPDARVGP